MGSLYHGFFDESGKAHQHPVIVFSGFVTTSRWWDALESEWRRLLREFNLAGVHFSEVKKRTSVLKKFIGLMRRYIECGVSVAVKVDDFRFLPEAMRVALGGDAHYLIFKMVVIALVRRVIIEDGARLTFTQDEDEKTTAHCFDWYKKIKRQMPDFQTKLVSFAVADDKYFPQLQASDIFAGLFRAQAETEYLGIEQAHRELIDELRKADENDRLRMMWATLKPTDLEAAARDWNEGMRGAGLLPSEENEARA